MKKIFLSFILLTSFSLWAFESDQTGCQFYCESLKDCCQEKNKMHPFGVQKPCDEQYKRCLEAYSKTPSDKCPEVELCN